MANKMKKTWVFYPETGITRVFESVKAAKESLINYDGRTLNSALYQNRPLKDGTFLSSKRISRDIKEELFNKHWEDKAKGEVWKSIKGIEVSNRGRARDEKGFLFPIRKKTEVCVYTNGIYLNLARLIVEAFILGRDLKRNERVYRKASFDNLQLEFLYVGEFKEVQPGIIKRTVGYEVELVDDEGNVLETFNSCAEAGRRFFMDRSTISSAIRNNRKCLGYKFRKAI